MFVASGQLALGSSLFRSSLALDHGVRLFAVERRRLVYDSRLVSAVASAQSTFTIALIVLAGEVQIEGRRIAAPALLLLDEATFDGPARIALRSQGDTYRALEARLPRSSFRSRAPSVIDVRDVSSALLDASMFYVQRALDDGAVELDDEARGVLRQLCAADILEREPELQTGVQHAITTRVWRAIAHVYGRGDLSATLKVVAATERIPLRSATRAVQLLYDDLPFPGRAWRETALGLRLKLASMFLSSDASIAEVARAMGYGRLEAMTHAFQRAGLGSPSEVRSRLLAPFSDDSTAT